MIENKGKFEKFMKFKKIKLNLVDEILFAIPTAQIYKINHDIEVCDKV